MIKFFRKIRQKLLSENKFSKYLIYAIGEIILVVIGILIALQINNWNENHKKRKLEKSVLHQINKEFKSNKVQLDSIQLHNKTVIEDCDAIISLMPFKKEKATIDSLVNYLPLAFSIKTFNPSNGSVESLINSSSFDVIQNDSLRNLLVTWKDVYNDYSEEEQYARNLNNWELIPYLTKNTSYISPHIDPFNEINLNELTSNSFNNMLILKRTSINDILKSIKDEQVEHYITEIIRLTKSDYNNEFNK